MRETADRIYGAMRALDDARPRGAVIWCHPGEKDAVKAAMEMDALGPPVRVMAVPWVEQGTAVVIAADALYRPFTGRYGEGVNYDGS